VARKPAAVAASMNRRRVLVVSLAAEAVTEASCSLASTSPRPRGLACWRASTAAGTPASLVADPELHSVAADRRSVLHLMRERNGRHLSDLHGPLAVRSLDVYGGWLVALQPRPLRLLGFPDGTMRSSVSLGSRIGGFAWAVPGSL
jgi:hypothetical protein